MDLTAAPGLIAERAVAPDRFAIGGTPPRFAARPADRDELCELLRAATRDQLAVVPWGGGAALPDETAPGRYDLALDMGGLDRVIEYEPEDLTLTAECGVTLATLRTQLAARGQELPLEGSKVARATLGGALASNTSGPRRLRFGAPRDRILGARFALGDGTLVRTGGKVVKNVAGFGIHRLLCGSRGGLAILVDASLKLLPAPAARAALVYEIDAAALGDALWSAFPRFEPAAMTVVGPARARRAAESASALPAASGRGRFWVAIGFEDDPPRIAELVAAVTGALGTPALALENAEADALYQAMCDLEDLGTPRLTFASAHNTPAALAALTDLAELETCVFHAPCGKLHLYPERDRAPSCVRRLSGSGFALVGARGVEVEPEIPPVGATRALRGRIRAALDPGGRFALGERWERTTG